MGPSASGGPFLIWDSKRMILKELISCSSLRTSISGRTSIRLWGRYSNLLIHVNIPAPPIFINLSPLYHPSPTCIHLHTFMYQEATLQVSGHLNHVYWKKIPLVKFLLLKWQVLAITYTKHSLLRTCILRRKHSIQYIPRNMHTVLLCFALLWLCNRS